MPDLSYSQFLKSLEQTESRLTKELGKILVKGALRMEKEAKRNATIDPKVRTGRLRSSITGLVFMKQGEPRVVLRAGGRSIRGSADGVADVNYAEKIELGLENIRYPRYYLRKAFRKEKVKLEQELQKALLKATE
tara:strand:- start:67 stop:471 length:405 start_codon:yes stop_codon:yes gene_type:complete